MSDRDWEYELLSNGTNNNMQPPPVASTTQGF